MATRLSMLVVTASRKSLGTAQLMALMLLGTVVVNTGCGSSPAIKQLCTGEGAEERAWALAEDPSRSQEYLALLRRCAEAGVADYQYFWGHAILAEVYEVGGDPILDKEYKEIDGLVWWAQAARQKLVPALEQWSAAFSNGWFGSEKDPEAAKACLEVGNRRSIKLCLNRIDELLKVLEEREGADHPEL